MILLRGYLKVPKSRFGPEAQFISKGQVPRVLQTKDMVEIKKIYLPNAMIDHTL